MDWRGNHHAGGRAASVMVPEKPIGNATRANEASSATRSSDLRQKMNTPTTNHIMTKITLLAVM